LKSFYADPLTPRGDLDPHRFLGQRVASTFAKDNHTTLYEGTVVSFDFLSLNYGINWDDALMVFHHDSLERKAARSGAFHFLVTKHRAGLSFEFRYNLLQHLFSPQNSYTPPVVN
jgi:hypothetical protein